MTERLSDCKLLLQHVRDFSSARRVTVVIRHSERISFDSVPMEKWDSVGITKNGAQAARMLGESLVQNTGAKKADVFGWGQKRCVETASAIADGMRSKGGWLATLRSLNLKGPIANRSSYHDFIVSGRMPEMLELWQRGRDIRNSLTPLAEYAPSVFSNILGQASGEGESLSVIVTHDLHVLPLISYALGKVVEPPDYLDGLVIGEDAARTLVGYDMFTDETNPNRLTEPR